MVDSRPKKCRGVKYDTGEDLTVTVIIPFYNEALSMLLRTIHSILRHTPESLLNEIIIIDDHSPNHDLKEPLESYVKLLPQVNVYCYHVKRESPKEASANIYFTHLFRYTHDRRLLHLFSDYVGDLVYQPVPRCSILLLCIHK